MREVDIIYWYETEREGGHIFSFDLCIIFKETLKKKYCINPQLYFIVWEPLLMIHKTLVWLQWPKKFQSNFTNNWVENLSIGRSKSRLEYKFNPQVFGWTEKVQYLHWNKRTMSLRFLDIPGFTLSFL